MTMLVQMRNGQGVEASLVAEPVTRGVIRFVFSARSPGHVASVTDLGSASIDDPLVLELAVRMREHLVGRGFEDPSGEHVVLQ